MNNFMSAGFVYVLGVFYPALLEEFGTSNAETTLMQSVCSGVFACTGMIKICTLYIPHIQAQLVYMEYNNGYRRQLAQKVKIHHNFDSRTSFLFSSVLSLYCSEYLFVSFRCLSF